MFRKSSPSGEEGEQPQAAEPTSGDDELLNRLQHMEWPKAPAELRERCWQEISRRISEMEMEGGDGTEAGGTAEPAAAGEESRPGEDAEPGSGEQASPSS